MNISNNVRKVEKVQVIFAESTCEIKTKESKKKENERR